LKLSVYIWIVIVSIEDSDLIVNRGKVVVPIAGIDVDPEGFFLFSTIIVSFLAIYLSIQSLIFSMGAGFLPYRFTDGILVEESIHQTLGNYALFFSRGRKSLRESWRYIFVISNQCHMLVSIFTIFVLFYRYLYSFNVNVVILNGLILIITFLSYLIITSFSEDLF
jgi:hypothetical protein